MRSKEYWDKTFEDRYEREKMNPERPPLKVIIEKFAKALGKKNSQAVKPDVSQTRKIADWVSDLKTWNVGNQFYARFSKYQTFCNESLISDKYLFAYTPAFFSPKLGVFIAEHPKTPQL